MKIESQSLTVPAIDQVWYEVHGRTKVEVLCRLIDLEDIRYALIFCATKIMVDELVEHLIARGYVADKLHGDMSQVMRERVMGRFRRRTVEFLVATDVAARGLDVKDFEVVFNYDLPNDGEDYVHRIGRTGRAGSEGQADHQQALPHFSHIGTLPMFPILDKLSLYLNFLPINA